MDSESPDNQPILNPESDEMESQAEVIALSQLVADFGDGLMQAVSRRNLPV